MSKKIKPDYHKKRQRIRLFEALPELSSGVIQICGTREASVDGCRGVVDYYDDRITLKLSDGTVTFFGTMLTVDEYLDRSVKIRGELKNIEFSCRTAKQVTADD